MADKFIIKEFENLDDMAEAIEELGQKVMFSDEAEDLDSYSSKRVGRDGRMKDYGSVATQHFLMAYAQLRAAEASMKLCVQNYHLEIDKQIAKKIRAGNIPTQYRDMSAKQIFAAMKKDPNNES